MKQMIDYIPKKHNQYYIGDRNLYKEILYAIQGYESLCKRREQIMYSNYIPTDGLPRGNATGDPTAHKAIKLSYIDAKIKAIDQTIVELRAKYTTNPNDPFEPYEAFKDYGVFCWYRSNPKKDKAPCERTWKYYRSEFIFKVAEKLGYF